MKIAMITTWFPPVIVGSGNRFYEIGKRLAGKHEVHVYTTGIEGSAKEEEIGGMRVHRYGRFNATKSMEKESYFFGSKFSFDVFRNFKKEHYDIIDCNIVSKILPYISYFISKFSDAPLIETWHEVLYKQNFIILRNPIIAFSGFLLELYAPKLADINIIVSETTRKRLTRLLNINEKRTVVIPNGVDLKKFNAIPVEKKQGRILYVGRLESHKCVDTLILAYRRLKKVYHDIELIIVGSGPQKESLQRLSKNMNLKDIIFYEPMPYEKLIRLMKSSWVLVLPSIREGQGIVLLEAMAAGAPPIAVLTPESGVGDVIESGYNGLLVSQGEIEGAIKKLLTDEDLYYKLRKNGLNFVKEYDWDKIAARTEEVYEQAKRIL